MMEGWEGVVNMGGDNKCPPKSPCYLMEDRWCDCCSVWMNGGGSDAGIGPNLGLSVPIMGEPVRLGMVGVRHRDGRPRHSIHPVLGLKVPATTRPACKTGRAGRAEQAEHADKQGKSR
jgi:hypothetical protein